MSVLNATERRVSASHVNPRLNVMAHHQWFNHDSCVCHAENQSTIMEIYHRFMDDHGWKAMNEPWWSLWEASGRKCLAIYKSFYSDHSHRYAQYSSSKKRHWAKKKTKNSFEAFHEGVRSRMCCTLHPSCVISINGPLNNKQDGNGQNRRHI